MNNKCEKASSVAVALCGRPLAVDVSVAAAASQPTKRFNIVTYNIKLHQNDTYHCAVDDK